MNDIKVKEFVRNFLNKIFTDFLSMKDRWCEINNFALNTSSYQHPYCQKYYLLKYFPAYLAEYYLIYKSFFERYQPIQVNILSIGCGVGIDYFSLQIYCSQHNNISIPIEYIGVDIIDWEDRCLLTPSLTNFIHSDIAEIDVIVFQNINVIFFPKILTELSQESLESISQKILSCHPSEIYFINSYITDNAMNNSRIRGIDKFQLICSNLIQNGYKVDSQCNTYSYYPNSDGIKNLCSFFEYPNEIKDKLANLQNICNRQNDQCDFCQINTYPILTSKYFAFNTFKFTR